MSVRSKLAAFVSVLVLVFFISIGAGRLFEGQVPQQPTSTSTHTHR